MTPEEADPSPEIPEVAGSTDEVFVQLYQELKRLASSKLNLERPEHTLQATALVHEAYIRLGKGENSFRWENKRQFFSTAAEAMRRILVDHARKKKSLKRGAEFRRAELDESKIVINNPPEEVLAVDDALEKFAAENSSGAELVKLRYFAGLTMQEAAEATGVSLRTAARQWSEAKKWLRTEIKGSSP